MFNVKPGLSPQNLSGEHTYYQSAFDLKKMLLELISGQFRVFFMEMGFMSQRRKMKQITVDQREY